MRSANLRHDDVVNVEKDALAWVIDVKKLQVGDIILSTTGSLISLGIRIVTRSSVSHASLHIGNGFVVEAVSDGVRRINARSLIYPKKQYIKVLRPNQITEEQLRLVSDNAKSLISRPYTAKGAAGSVVPLIRQRNDPGRFCSQIVAESYALAKLPLYSNKTSENITPDNILRCNFFDDITGSPVVRSVRRGSLFHSLGQMQPSWKHQDPNLWEEKERISPERFEQEILDAFLGIRKEYACFDDSYHYSDVLRQLRRAWDENKDAALAVNEAILEVFKRYAAGRAVEPKVTFPGLISSTPSLDFPLVFESGEHPTDDEETLRLREEILYGRSSDENEWESSVSECTKLGEETNLSAYATIRFWMWGDLGRMRATYQWLSMEN